MTPALTKAAIEYMLAHDITLGGSLTLHSDPTTGLQAATKNYVDTTIASKVVKEKIYDSGKVNYKITRNDNFYGHEFTLPAGTNLNYQRLLFETIVYKGSTFKNDGNDRVLAGFYFKNSLIGYKNLTLIDSQDFTVNYKNDIHDYILAPLQYQVVLSNDGDPERSYMSLRTEYDISGFVQVNDYNKITNEPAIICEYKNVYNDYSVSIDINVNIQLIIYGIS